MSLAWYSLGPYTVCLEFSLWTADLAHEWAACGLWPDLGSGLTHLCVRSWLSIPRQAERFSPYPLRGDPDQAGFQASAWILPLRILRPSSATQLTLGHLCLSGYSFLRLVCRSASLKLHPWFKFCHSKCSHFLLPKTAFPTGMREQARREAHGGFGNLPKLNTIPTHPHRELGWALKPHESSYLWNHCKSYKLCVWNTQHDHSQPVFICSTSGKTVIFLAHAKGLTGWQHF